MNLVDITIQENHLRSLHKILKVGETIEGAAYMLWSMAEVKSDPWDRQKRVRFKSYEIIPISEEEMISASANHVTWSTKSYVKLLKKAKEENLIIGIVHNHPNGYPVFSQQDDANEAELARTAIIRNGHGTNVISLLLTGNQLKARVWVDRIKPIDIPQITTVGRNLRIYNQSQSDISEIFARQTLFLGEQANQIFKRLRIGIVGCGGTGSATAVLLARLGIGQLILFDDDIVDVTNLNRLHGSKRSDADIMRRKVDVVTREIAEMGLGVRVVAKHGWISDPKNYDALKACDLIFCCTDDNDGRLFLNRFSYFYLTPIIDMGLAINTKPNTVTGRVSVVVPDAPCLLCRGVANPIEARNEELKRKTPEEYERRKREAYIKGADNPSPAVVTFTTAIACLAVDEFLQGITGFRGDSGWNWQIVRHFDKNMDRKQGVKRKKDCSICNNTDYWGRADIKPFMDRVG